MIPELKDRGYRIRRYCEAGNSIHAFVTFFHSYILTFASGISVGHVGCAEFSFLLFLSRRELICACECVCVRQVECMYKRESVLVRIGELRFVNLTEGCYSLPFILVMRVGHLQISPDIALTIRVEQEHRSVVILICV